MSERAALDPELAFEPVELGGEIAGHRVVGLVVEQLSEVLRIGAAPGEVLPAGDFVPNPGCLLGERSRTPGVVPELRVGCELVELRYARTFSREVKDAPGVR